MVLSVATRGCMALAISHAAVASVWASDVCSDGSDPSVCNQVQGAALFQKSKVAAPLVGQQYNDSHPHYITDEHEHHDVKDIDFTSYGDHCKNADRSISEDFCEKHGYDYSWCYVKNGTWDYCVVRNETAHGYHCARDGSDEGFCGNHGLRYSWCYVAPNSPSSWDYCEMRDDSVQLTEHQWAEALALAMRSADPEILENVVRKARDAGVDPKYLAPTHKVDHDLRAHLDHKDDTDEGTKAA